MAKYVIVGASAAGVGAVEAIRAVDPTGTITIVTEEACAYYSRPMISDLVSGKADLQKMKCKTDDFFTKHGAELLLNKKVASLNIEEKTLTLDDGKKISYEKLLLATGGKP